MFAFSWNDLASLMGVEVDTAQKQAAAGKFDPTDLESVARFWASRQPTSAVSR